VGSSRCEVRRSIWDCDRYAFGWRDREILCGIDGRRTGGGNGIVGGSGVVWGQGLSSRCCGACDRHVSSKGGFPKRGDGGERSAKSERMGGFSTGGLRVRAWDSWCGGFS